MDRKALIRDYKQRRAPMGVYRVMNSVTGNALVAASTDTTSNLNRHRAMLGMGGHTSRALQEDWARYGSASFVFEVLDTLTPPDEPNYDPIPDLTALEDLWLEKLSLTADRQYTIDHRRLKPPVRKG
jgi:hypothetical protein